MTALRIILVDAFTAVPWRGNPAAVCLLDPPRDDAWLQGVAREMNQSETAFLWRRDDGFALRWFTPTLEVPLCGHATLASAHALWSEGVLATDAPARFHTASGDLVAQRAGEWIRLDFPALPATGAAVPAAAIEALGATAVGSADARLLYVVEVESAAAVRQLTPDLRRLAAASSVGVCVTSRADVAGYDVVSRFFAPSHGIDEDPVTGAAHCALAPYWTNKLGKTELRCWQASPRGGEVRVRLAGNGRAEVRGQAVTVLGGELAIDAGAANPDNNRG
ncbi:MAG: PhzF family phenazine biosynthesis protein [bacterium]